MGRMTDYRVRICLPDCGPIWRCEEGFCHLPESRSFWNWYVGSRDELAPAVLGIMRCNDDLQDVITRYEPPNASAIHLTGQPFDIEAEC